MNLPIFQNGDAHRNLGDILLANEIKLIDNNINFKPFDKIKNDIIQFDFVFANLETPISTRGIPVKNRTYIFETNPAIAKSLKEINLDIASISNNHLMDFGIEGMTDTFKYLKKWNIQYTGAGNTLKEARVPAVLKYGDTDIYFLSYCGRPPEKYYATKKLPGISPLILNHIIEDIQKYKKRNNIVLVSLHWGIEHTNTPQVYQIKLAHQIIDAGADGIIGHHPHWPQGIEIYRNKPVIYSLGNFVNGHYNKIEKNNIITAFYYNKTKLEEIEVYSIAGKNKDIKFQPYIIKGKKAQSNLSVINSLSRKFNTKINIFGYKGIIKFN